MDSETSEVQPAQQQSQEVVSWYHAKHEFTEAELAYIDFLEKTFLVQNEFREWIPYRMTEYQKEFHAASINIKLQDAEDLLINKGRGISFTWSTLIDLIATGMLFDDVTIPVIAQREGTAAKHIKTAQSIIRHCKLKDIRELCEFTTNGILFTKTKTVMESYPSSSAADAVRGMRLITGLIDEYAFQERAEELLAASQDTMQGDLGQLKIGSTAHGRNNKFFELVDAIHKGQNIGFKLFEFPVFDPKKFNPNKLPSEQCLVPIAPWISLKALDKKWRRDREIFLQENMCDFLDDSLSLIKYTTIAKAINEDLENHRDAFYRDALFVHRTNNPIFVGVDVATTNDYFSVVAFEEFSNSDGRVTYQETWLDYFRGVETPALEAYLDNLFRVYPTLIKMRIDSTGLGTYLPSYLKKKHGSKVEGINFSTRVSTEDAKEKAGIKVVMCTNLKRMFEDGQVSIFNDGLQTKHLGAIDYSFSAPRDADGHGDIFFAMALALLKSRYSVSGKGRTVEVTSSSMGKVVSKPIDKMDIMDRIEFYKKQSKSSNRMVW